jgi:hypothetical protein
LVEDVSRGGLKICTAERLSVGKRLRFSIPKIGFSASVIVVWSNADEAGLVFEMQHGSPADLAKSAPQPLEVSPRTAPVDGARPSALTARPIPPE